MDLIGIIHHCSASGHAYLLVRYIFDANVILVEPLRNRQENTIADIWENINSQFAKSGVLDNEISNILKKAFEKYTTKYKLVPPHSH